MTPTTAIQRAEQWRKENACGEAAKVAIALLNELERYADKSADYALKASEYAGKYANLLQAVTDPENQPNQYGATVVTVDMSADKVRAYAIYRTNPEENDGKEFFYYAMWHNDTIPGDGERVVPGHFIPDDGSLPAASKNEK